MNRPSKSEIPIKLAAVKLVSTDQLAEILGFTPLHVRRLAASGRIPKPIVIGGRSLRWRSGEIAAFLAGPTPQ